MQCDRINSRDAVRMALYRLELSILPYVGSEHELRRRLRRMETLRSGLRVVDQMALIREFDALELPAVES
jgi:hypothetical protein